MASYLLFGLVPAGCFVDKCFSSEIAFFIPERCLTCRTFLQDLNRDQACLSLVWKKKKKRRFQSWLELYLNSFTPGIGKKKTIRVWLGACRVGWASGE